MRRFSRLPPNKSKRGSGEAGCEQHGERQKGAIRSDAFKSRSGGIEGRPTLLDPTSPPLPPSPFGRGGRNSTEGSHNSVVLAPTTRAWTAVIAARSSTVPESPPTSASWQGRFVGSQHRPSVGCEDSFEL